MERMLLVFLAAVTLGVGVAQAGMSDVAAKPDELKVKPLGCAGGCM